MKPQIIAQYTEPDQFEPLLPGHTVSDALHEKAADLIREATALQSSTQAHRELREVLRGMNSYYTNAIEGEHTRPSEIEQALQNDFSGNADTARKQRLALAHIETEKISERTLAEQAAGTGNAVGWLYSTAGLCWLHERLFAALPPQDLQLADGSMLAPGQLRTRQVAVRRHEPPLYSTVPRFLDRWADRYVRVRRGEMAVVAMAASHHRLAWIHPFADGNGRLGRLHTHLLLQAQGLTNGLWSPLRGFARSEARYKALLEAADAHRRGDLDGRGNLSQAALVDWIGYVLDMSLDQVRFMAGQLDIGGMQDRLHASLVFDSQASTGAAAGVRIEALRPLHYLFATQGELPRADFKQMTGLGERTATSLVSALLKSGYVASDTPYGALRFAVPRHALRFLFPNLWPEAERDEAMLKPGAAPKRG